MGQNFQFLHKMNRFSKNTSSELPSQLASLFHSNVIRKSQADRFACEMKIEEISINYACVLHTCACACVWDTKGNNSSKKRLLNHVNYMNMTF